jgi:CheY-like chemotaxis protein
MPAASWSPDRRSRGPDAAKSGLAAVTRRPTLLVVDDTPQNVKVLEAVLAPRGYTLVAARSGPEALQKVAADPPDLVLLDVVMPGMSGYEVCRRLRADPANILNKLSMRSRAQVAVWAVEQGLSPTGPRA